MIFLKASPRGWFWNLSHQPTTWPNFYSHNTSDVTTLMLNLLLFVGLTLTYPSLGQSEIFWMYKFYLCSKTKTTSVGFEPVNLGLTLGALTDRANEWGENRNFDVHPPSRLSRKPMLRIFGLPYYFAQELEILNMRPIRVVLRASWNGNKTYIL